MQQSHSRNKTVKWQKSSFGVYHQNRSTDPDKNYMIANGKRSRMFWYDCPSRTERIWASNLATLDAKTGRLKLCVSTSSVPARKRAKYKPVDDASTNQKIKSNNSAYNSLT